MSALNSFKGLDVLVTGACGTVGKALVTKLIDLDVNRIVCIDNNETELFFLQEKFKSLEFVHVYLADITDSRSLSDRFKNIDIVLHSAALKHVGLCEESPNMAIQTNILGIQNVIDAALTNDVSRVLFTSSDKAVNPTNVMGTTKLMGERLMTAAGVKDPKPNTIFASTRFGNILGSNGSVIPLFKRQAEQGGPITLTDIDMTRFVMSLEEACDLVLESTFLAKGGEVFVTKMPVARIEDVASIMQSRYSTNESEIGVKVIGSKPGEKMYEELMNEEEVRRTFDIGKFLVVLPAFSRDKESTFPIIKGCMACQSAYSSENEDPMDLGTLKNYLTNIGLL